MDPWTLTATEPHAGRLYLANGYMSTALDWAGGVLFESESSPCYIRGVYNNTGPDGIDRLAAGPSWSQMRYGHPGTVQSYRRDLDLRRGICRTCFLIEDERGRVQIEETFLVSRADRHQAAVRLAIRPEFDGDLVVYAALEAAYTEDVETLDADGEGESIWLLARTRKYAIEVGTELSFPENGWESEDSVGQNIVTRRLTREGRAGEEAVLTQFVRVATGLECEEPMALARQPSPAFERVALDHEHAWARLWETDIEIDGDPGAQQFARAALFYLWSTVREGDHWSIAPMGLSSNGYNGHIFWDAELWMYPSLLLTQPDMSRSCVAYRERTMRPARERAAVNGCRGAQFPWESAFTGEEMTPYWAETRDFQLHITADVAIAQWWYYLNSLDLPWLRDHGFPVIRECAEFWASRVEHNAALDRYEISDVVCADEYAAHVDNNAFTNAAVRQALLIAERAAAILGEPAPKEWRTIADRLHIPYDEKTRRHLEFDGYDDRVTKQADVELLAYPLEYVGDPEQMARDLDFYGGVIDPNGPAMSFSVYAIVSAQLGRARAAYDYLLRSYVPNTRPPFQAFSETPTNNEFLFCTGVGGALQALLFGFSGIRLREGYFVLDPILPEQWQSLRLHNLYLAGARTDIDIVPGRITLRRHLDGQRLTVDLERADHGVELRAGWDDPPQDAVVVQLAAAHESDASSRTLESGERTTLPDALESGLRLRVVRPHDTTTTEGDRAALDVLIRQPRQPGRPLG